MIIFYDTLWEITTTLHTMVLPSIAAKSKTHRITAIGNAFFISSSTLLGVSIFIALSGKFPVWYLFISFIDHTIFIILHTFVYLISIYRLTISYYSLYHTICPKVKQTIRSVIVWNYIYPTEINILLSPFFVLY